MREEIEATVKFISSHFESANFSEPQLTDFRERLVTSLTEKYQNHWYPDNPQKGSAFRAITVDHIDLCYQMPHIQK